MNTENQSPNPYDAVLADLRAKRTEIDNTIRILEGLSGLKLTADDILSSRNERSDRAVADDVDGAGAFLGMSIVDATKKLLSNRKRAMNNPEIAKALLSGGLAMSSVDPVNTIGSVLTRRFNQVGDVVKISRGTWGLKEWYPNRNFKKGGTVDSSKPTETEAEDDGHIDPNPPFDL